MMPAHVDNFVYWRKDEVDYGLRLFQEEESRLFEGANASWTIVQRYGILTREQFIWGYSMLASRSFNSERGALMLPVADLFNHCSNPNVKHLGLRLLAGYTMGFQDNAAFVLSRNVSKGEELCISYGDRTNWEFLVGYGFVERDNPHDAFVLRNVSLGAPWSLRGENVTLRLTWKGVRPASVVHYLDAHSSSSYDSFSLSRWKQGAPDAVAWGTAVRKICLDELRASARISVRFKRFLPLWEERLRMLRHCAATLR